MKAAVHQPPDLEKLIKNPKDREVKLSKAKMLNVAAPWRSLRLISVPSGSQLSWASSQPIIPVLDEGLFLFCFSSCYSLVLLNRANA